MMLKGRQIVQNKRDVVLSPRPGLLILLFFNPGLLILWRLRRKKVNGIGRLADFLPPRRRRSQGLRPDLYTQVTLIIQQEA
jgi:hypothetical protein